MSQILSNEDRVTLSYMRQQSSNALMCQTVELVERMSKHIDAMRNEDFFGDTDSEE